jgi:hypothetical protein
MCGLGAAGSSRWDSPGWAELCWLDVALAGLEAVREAAEERRGVAFGNELVLGGTAFLLGAFRGEQVAEAGSATHELAFGSKLEAFGNGLFGLLHELSGRKHWSAPAV